MFYCKDRKQKLDFTSVHKSFNELLLDYWEVAHDASDKYSYCFLCAIKWCLRLTFRVNVFPHLTQQNGFSPLWLRRWHFRLPFWVNPFPHTQHRWGFSPVWTTVWILSADKFAKVFPHSRHDLLSLRAETRNEQVCELNLYLWGNCCLQMLQKFDLWHFMWCVRVPLWKNVMPHISHGNLSLFGCLAVSTWRVLKSSRESGAVLSSELLAGNVSCLLWLGPPSAGIVGICWISSTNCTPSSSSSPSSIGMVWVLKASSESLMEISWLVGSSSWSNDRPQVLPPAEWPGDRSGSSAVFSSCSVAQKQQVNKSKHCGNYFLMPNLFHSRTFWTKGFLLVAADSILHVILLLFDLSHSDLV